MEGPRSERDARFARDLGGELVDQMLSAEIRPMSFNHPDAPAALILAKMMERVAQHVNSTSPDLPSRALRFFKSAIITAQLVLVRSGSEVLMLTRPGNGLDLDVMVDIFNDAARSGLEALAGEGGADGGQYDGGAAALPAPGAEPYSPGWARAMAAGSTVARIASARDAASSFLTLLADALRLSKASGGGGGAGAGGGGPTITFTVNCNLTGWTLKASPQFLSTPSAFGKVATWPVTDVLPTSGNYSFQGRKGTAFKKDPTPHFAGPSRTSTLVHF